MQAKPSKVRPAVYGGIIMGVISGVPFLSLINCCCCAGILFGGLMAVFFYKKDLTHEMPPLSSNDALVVGALAGVFGAVVASVLDGLFMLALGNLTGEKVAELIREFYDRSGVTGDLPPGTLDQLDALRNAQFSVLKVFQSFIIHPLFGLLGGLIGYAVFKPKPEVPAVPPTP